MRISIVALGLSAAFVAVAPMASSDAQTTESAYPSRIVRIIAGSAGADADVVARLLANGFSKRWPYQAIVENNAAAGGPIGTGQCGRATPDGHTLCIGHVGTHASAPSLYKDLSYDPEVNFATVTMASVAPIIMVAHPSVQANNLNELVKLVRANPGKLSFSSAGVGTASHLTGELFATATKLKLLHVPYRGASPALTSVIAGDTNISFLSLATAIEQVRSGKLMGITIFSQKRFPVAPEVPTAIEQGYPDLVSTAWFGLFAPAETPAPIVAKLNKDATEIFSTADVRNALLTKGAEAFTTTPQEMAEFLRAEIVKWKQVVQNAGIGMN
jgi:tripartite-type tricarboxylate transporter receptor subunit TctC